MTSDEVRKLLDGRREAIARVLSSEDGRLLLEAIEVGFHPSRLLGKDDREMHFNLGAFAVATYLRDVRDAALRQKGVARG